MSSSLSPTWHGKWYCECQVPGQAKSHTFETLDEDTARAMCDAHGWEFLRAWQAGSDSDRPATRSKGGKSITARQVTALICEARKTYDHLAEFDDMPSFDDWRAQQLEFIARESSFKLVPRSRFNQVRNAFRSLRGAPPIGNSHDHRKQTSEAGDTMDRRQHFLHLMAELLGWHARRVDKPQNAEEQDAANHAIQKGGAIGEAYLVTLAAAKNKGHDIRQGHPARERRWFL